MSLRESKLSQCSNESIDVGRTEASSLDAIITCKTINEEKKIDEVMAINDNRERRDSESEEHDVVNISGMTTAIKSDDVDFVIERSSVENELEQVKSYLMEWLEDHDYFEDEDVNAGTPFAEMGLSSIDSVTLSEDVRIALGVELDATVAWQYPNVDRLSKHITELKYKNSSTESSEDVPKTTADLNNKIQRSPVCTAMEDLSFHEVAKSLKELIFGKSNQKDSVEAK